MRCMCFAFNLSCPGWEECWISHSVYSVSLSFVCLCSFSLVHSIWLFAPKQLPSQKYIYLVLAPFHILMHVLQPFPRLFYPAHLVKLQNSFFKGPLFGGLKSKTPAERKWVQAQSYTSFSGPCPGKFQLFPGIFLQPLFQCCTTFTGKNFSSSFHCAP